MGGFLFRTGRHGVRTDLEAKRRLLIQRGERRQDHGGLQIRLLFIQCAAHGTIFLLRGSSRQEVRREVWSYDRCLVADDAFDCAVL